MAALIADLRSSLGDHAGEPRFIRTVYAFGYAFVGDVVAPPVVGGPGHAARWLLHFNGREFPLRDGENILGRTGEAPGEGDGAGSNCAVGK